MQAYLYHYNTDNMRVDKSSYLSQAKAIDIKLLDDTSIINPTIKINLTTPINQYNYMYIPEMGRYYYIKNKTFTKGWFNEIQLECDVLNTYKNIIYNGKGLVTRYQNGGNFLIPDNRVEFQTNKQITPFVGSEFTGQPSFVLTVAGGR